MMWLSFLKAKKPEALQIVVLDGKNSAHGLFADLQKQGLPAHIFVTNFKGEARHNPMFKADDYSRTYRTNELDKISRLHGKNGIGAVIAICDMHADERELKKAVEKIHTFAPKAKILVASPSYNGPFFADNGKDRDAIEKLMYEKKVIFKDDKEVPLAGGIDVAVGDYNNVDRIAATLHTLLPHLKDVQQQAGSAKGKGA